MSVSETKNKEQKEDNYITIEVVSLREVSLKERRKVASKPLYLTRY